jgi:hypothetical protein
MNRKTLLNYAHLRYQLRNGYVGQESYDGQAVVLFCMGDVCLCYSTPSGVKKINPSRRSGLMMCVSKSRDFIPGQIRLSPPTFAKAMVDRRFRSSSPPVGGFGRAGSLFRILIFFVHFVILAFYYRALINLCG